MLETVLIDPENGGLLKVVMVNDHKLDTKFVEYVKDVIDLKGFTDPASKGSKSDVNYKIINLYTHDFIIMIT